MVYLKNTVQYKELHEKEIPISRPLVHVHYGSIHHLSLKSHCDVVYGSEVSTLKFLV